MAKLVVGKVKALFIHSKDGMTFEDAINIAKAEAEKIGMGHRNLQKIVHIEQLNLPSVKGFVVVVQTAW